MSLIAAFPAVYTSDPDPYVPPEPPSYESYKYYRVYISNFRRNASGNLRDWQNMAELKIYDENDVEIGQANLVNVTASSYYSSTPPSNAVDGNDSTFWESDWKTATNTTGWIMVELDEPRPAAYFTITRRPGNAPLDFIKTGVIQGSNDGTTFTDLVQINEPDGNSEWVSNITLTFNVPL